MTETANDELRWSQLMGNAQQGDEQSYAKLLAWDEKTGNSLGLAITANNMGHIFERYYGDYEEAEKKYLQALRIFEELGKERLAQSVKEKLERLRSD